MRGVDKIRRQVLNTSNPNTPNAQQIATNGGVRIRNSHFDENHVVPHVGPLDDVSPGVHGCRRFVERLGRRLSAFFACEIWVGPDNVIGSRIDLCSMRV